MPSQASASAAMEDRPALLEKYREGYESRKKSWEEERKKAKKNNSIDIKQLTIDASASATPTKA